MYDYFMSDVVLRILINDKCIFKNKFALSTDGLIIN